MDLEKLKTANELNTKINQCKQALECFIWEPYDQYTGEKNGEQFSTNPELIIEFDGDGRDTVKLPFSLSSHFIEYIKKTLIENIQILETEFKNL